MSNVIPFKYVTDIVEFKKEAQEEEVYIRKLGFSTTYKNYFSAEVLGKHPELKNVGRWLSSWWKQLSKAEPGEEKAERGNLYSMSELEQNRKMFVSCYIKKKSRA